MRIFAILFTSLMMTAGMVQAETSLTPEDLIGSIILDRATCQDRESGDHGRCFILSHEGDIYMIFHDQEGARFIRRLRPDMSGYDIVWQRPQGISL